MRAVGTLANRKDAVCFTEVLGEQYINSEIDRNQNDEWVIWVHSEEHIAQSATLFAQFSENPTHDDWQQAAFRYRQRTMQEQQQQIDALQSTTPTGVPTVRLPDTAKGKRGTIALKHFPRVSLFVSILTVGVALFVGLDVKAPGAEYFFFDYLQAEAGSFSAISNGEIWRLIAPSFFHLGLLHVLLNVWIWGQLGAEIEVRLGSLSLAITFLLVSIGSNTAQYFHTGPDFAGLSGVFYGLLGFIWLRGIFDKATGLHVHPLLLGILLFILVYYSGQEENSSDGLTRIANTAHTAGLLIGSAWGALTGIIASKKRGTV